MPRLSTQPTLAAALKSGFDRNGPEYHENVPQASIVHFGIPHF
jgi:hypothetical protein